MRPLPLFVAAGLALLPATGLAAGRIAQAPPAAVGPAAQPPSSSDDDADGSQLRAFEDRVASFVREFYLAGGPRSTADLERLYAPTVEYFGNRRLTRARVISDKYAYFRRWPTRSYELLRDTLSVTRRSADARIYDITFEYTFDVAGPSRTSRGRGTAMMTMDLDQDGGRITRETGRVLQRW